jgi:hypothetical protein
MCINCPFCAGSFFGPGVSDLEMSVVSVTIVLRHPPLRKDNKMNTSIDNIDNYTETFASLIEYATYGDIEKAALWYADAERVALEVARNLDASLEVGASVVSAFSPRERWSSNVTKAIAFSLGEKVTGYPTTSKWLTLVST